MIGKLWPANLQISLKTNLFTDRSEYVVIWAGKHSKLFKTNYFYSFMTFYVKDLKEILPIIFTPQHWKQKFSLWYYSHFM